MPNIDWQKIFELLPFAVGALRPGSPNAGAFMRGGLETNQYLRQQRMEQDRYAQEDRYRQAQLANMQADNARQQESLDLQKKREGIERLLRGVESLTPAITSAAETSFDPAQAENQVLQRAQALEGALGLPGSALSGFVPPMAPMISRRKTKRAQELYERAEKTYGPEAVANDAITLQTGELFGDVKPSQLRAIFEAPAMNLQGQPAAPYVKPTNEGVPTTERLSLRAWARERGKSAAELTADELLEFNKRFKQSDDKPSGPPPLRYQRAQVMNDKGELVEANYDALSGQYIDVNTGQRLTNLRPKPTAEMQNRQDALKGLVPMLRNLKAMSEDVIQRIGPAQRANAVKRGVEAVFGSDPTFRTYQDFRSSLAVMISVATQGSRPSDADVFRAALPMVPDPYRDTSESTKQKWDLIFDMFRNRLSPEMQQQLDLAPAGDTGPSGKRFKIISVK